MLTANHSKFSKFLFDLYIYPLLKRNFYAINLIGDIPNTNPEYPIIIAPNHSSWWDGFFLYLLNEKFFKRKFFIMILESSLEKYSFFRKLGGYSINQESPKSIVKSLNYTVEQMTDNQQSFFTIFPQGILLPPLFQNIILVKE